MEDGLLLLTVNTHGDKEPEAGRAGKCSVVPASVSLAQRAGRFRSRWSRPVLLASVPATKDAQLWDWSLEAGDRYDAQPDPVGWSEMLFVSEGSISVEQEHGDTELRTGDHLAFPTSQQYAYVNVGDTRACFVRVVIS